ncbi:MAG: AAA family ATPase, partial [bacterium]
MTQKEALDILKMGHSAFVTGAAGSGKTYLLNQYIKYLKDNDVEVGVTASTGIAASHMGGQTIHAWSGLGIRSSLSPCDIENLEEKPYLWKRFEKTKVLIIDEISMLHHFRLNLVDQVLQSFKRNNLPFGGLQVIFCGDFFQLPPVSREGEEESLFAYHSESWNNLAPKICYLEEQHRQNDDAFLEILNSIRKNNVTPEIIYKLNSSCQGKVNSKDEPTKIYSHNANVDIENERELEKIPGKMFEYEMINKGQEFLAETLKKGCLSPERLRLKKDARVIFTKNNFEEGYVNGTQGIITACDNSGITVRTVSGKTINVNPARWTIEEDGKIKAE